MSSEKDLRGFRTFQKHGVAVDAGPLGRLQTWSSIFLAGYIVASKSAILAHTLRPEVLARRAPPSLFRAELRSPPLPVPFGAARFGPVRFGVFVFLESQRAWRTSAETMAYLAARARAPASLSVCVCARVCAE